MTIPKPDLNRLAIVLIEKKKNKTWLAEQLGVSRSAVSKWTNNTGQPTLSMLFQIAKVLGVEVPELLNLRQP